MNSALHPRSQALIRSRRSSGHSKRAIIQEETARPKGAGIFLRAFSNADEAADESPRASPVFAAASVITAAVEQFAVIETPRGRFSRP